MRLSRIRIKQIDEGVIHLGRIVLFRYVSLKVALFAIRISPILLAPKMVEFPKSKIFVIPLPCGTKFLWEFIFADWRFFVFCGN